MFTYDAASSTTLASVGYLPGSETTVATGPHGTADWAQPVEPRIRSIPAMVRSLPDMRLTLLAPVPVLVSESPTNATVSSSVLDVYGVGDHVAEAMNDWYEEVVREFFFLSGHEADLGGPLLERWLVFRAYLTETLFQ